jgi:hypothetical protein
MGTPKKTAPKKTAPKKTAPKKTAPKKTAPKKTAPKKTAPKKTAPKKTVRDLRARIEDDFLEIGQELVTLIDPAVIEAMGYEDFAAVCADAIGMSAGKARQLIAVTTRLAPQLARSLGQDRAVALLSLVDATPEEDSPAEVWKATLTLPDGAKLDVDKASTQAIRDAATMIRREHAAKTGKARRGLTVTAEEQAAAKKIEKAIAGDKALAGTSVTLKAGTKAKGARVVIAVQLGLAARMAKAVGKRCWAPSERTLVGARPGSALHAASKRSPAPTRERWRGRRRQAGSMRFSGRSSGDPLHWCRPRGRSRPSRRDRRRGGRAMCSVTRRG